MLGNPEMQLAALYSLAWANVSAEHLYDSKGFWIFRLYIFELWISENWACVKNLYNLLSWCIYILELQPHQKLP